MEEMVTPTRLWERQIEREQEHQQWRWQDAKYLRERRERNLGKLWGRTPDQSALTLQDYNSNLFCSLAFGWFLTFFYVFSCDQSPEYASQTTLCVLLYGRICFLLLRCERIKVLLLHIITHTRDELEDMMLPAFVSGTAVPPGLLHYCIQCRLYSECCNYMLPCRNFVWAL